MKIKLFFIFLCLYFSYNSYGYEPYKVIGTETVIFYAPSLPLSGSTIVIMNTKKN